MSPPTPTSLLAGLGLVTSLVLTYKAASILYIYSRPSALGRYLHTTAAGQGAWALVTGASAGIGVEFARSLASAGFNIVLHGRNKAKLNAVRDDLVTAFPDREFRVLVIDAALCHDPKHVRWDTVATPANKDLADIHLTVLINNAGGGDDRFEPLWRHERPSVINEMNLNASFPLLMLHAFLPRLVACGGPALVINIGSMAEDGLPCLATYAASKAFVRTLTQAVAREMRFVGADVEVLHMRAGQVTGTNMVSVARSWGVPDAPTFVRAALARVGCGVSVVAPYFPHAVLQWATMLMPWWAKDAILVRIIRRLKVQGLKGAAKNE
jgi:17beta-estradiol 17-dehydrogenase / very-long-chain 3-oxoacyl-CoA reductase